MVFVAVGQENCRWWKSEQQLPVRQIFVHARRVVVGESRTHIDPDCRAVQVKNCEVGTEAPDTTAKGKVQVIALKPARIIDNTRWISAYLWNQTFPLRVQSR